MAKERLGCCAPCHQENTAPEGNGNEPQACRVTQAKGWIHSVSLDMGWETGCAAHTMAWRDQEG